MEAFVVSKQQNNKLIIYCHGWGMSPNTVQHIDNTSYDIIHLYNYGSDYQSIQFDIDKYIEINLIAWSYGVWIASRMKKFEKVNFNKSIAIAGSVNPVSETEGIPPAIFEATCSTLDEPRLEKFYRRMCSDAVSYNFFRNSRPDRSFSSVNEELLFFKNAFNGINTEQNECVFKSALICRNDAIFPLKSVSKSWTDREVPLKELEYGHYFFDKIESWEQILKMAEE